MKSIQATALILWMLIFIAAAFILGQFLASKNIFDLTSIITGESGDKNNDNGIIDDELANDVVNNKIGKETVRVGLNVAKNYFEDYYKDYINYLMGNLEKYNGGEKVVINDVLASDYVFYAIANNIDKDKYFSNNQDNNIGITEAEVNSFIDKMFEKNIDAAYKKQGKYGYDKINKEYSVEKTSVHSEYSQEIEKIENITSNKVILEYSCFQIADNKNNKPSIQNKIQLTVEYTGGRYIVTEILIEN